MTLERRALPSAARFAFVRRCAARVGAGEWHEAMVLNLGSTGAYIAAAAIPAPGELVAFRFCLPGSTREIELGGPVAWVNRTQRHPIHSLPPGFGVSFRGLSEDVRLTLADVVASFPVQSAPTSSGR